MKMLFYRLHSVRLGFNRNMKIFKTRGGQSFWITQKKIFRRLRTVSSRGFVFWSRDLIICYILEIKYIPTPVTNTENWLSKVHSSLRMGVEFAFAYLDVRSRVLAVVRNISGALHRRRWGGWNCFKITKTNVHVRSSESS